MTHRSSSRSRPALAATGVPASWLASRPCIATRVLLLAACTGTRACTDEQGPVIPGSIASMEMLPIGGVARSMWFRGVDVGKPAIVLLHGGPGASEAPLFRYGDPALERVFLMVSSLHSGLAGASMTACLRASLALAFALLMPGAHATPVDIPKDRAELTQEATMRCIYDMSEFGDDAVRVCVEADLAAADALQNYPASQAGGVQRCLENLWARGYGMVQVCVEQDLAAAAALADLGAQHAQTLDACRQKHGTQGAAAVKQCVDQALNASPAAPK